MPRNGLLTKVKVYSPHRQTYMHLPADRVVCGVCDAFASVRGNFKWEGNSYRCKTCGTSYPKSERNTQ